MSHRPLLRIVNEGALVGPKTRVLLVDSDDAGNEVITDVTEALRVSEIGVSLKVGSVARARLECLCVTGEIDAQLDELAIRFVGRTRFGRIVWRLKKWWWNVRVPVVDTTVLGQAARTAAPGRRERW